MYWLIWTTGAASGPILVVDGSRFFEVVDVEVLGVIRAQNMRGGLDGTAARQAVADLREWPKLAVGAQRSSRNCGRRRADDPRSGQGDWSVGHVEQGMVGGQLVED